MKKFFKNYGFLLAVIAIVLVLRLFIFSPVKVSGHSMDPTLADGQRLIASKITTYSRGDIITCEEPDEDGRLIVKRIIGLPGDHVVMNDDQLTINDDTVPEDYLASYQAAFNEDQLQSEYDYDADFQYVASQAENFTSDFDYTVPAGEYLVLGDNRLISKDSRYFGFVKENAIKGEVVLRYWPLAEVQLF
ncbi:MAG: signal peptidase I [Enterococcus sp.]